MVLSIILLTALINFVLGIISYNKNPRSMTNRLLTLLTIIFALWTVSNYFSLNAANPEDTLFWIRAVMFITAPLGPVLYLFIKAFPHADLKVNKIVFRLLVFGTLIVQAIAFTPLIFSKVTITDQITPTPGPGIVLFALLFVGVPILGFWELIRKYRKSSGLEKLQLRYLIVGIAETFALLIITNFIAVIVFNYSGFVIFGPIFSLILVGFLTYAIIRHRLLEIRIILARSVVYVILLVLVAALYAFGVIIAIQYLLQTKLNTQQISIDAILALFVVFTFVPLRSYIENATNRIFFKGRYDQHDLVFQLTRIIASTIALEDVTTKSLNKLLTTLRIAHGTFIIFEKNRKVKIISKGKTAETYERKSLQTLYAIKRLVVFDEEKNKSIKELMRQLDIAIILPLFERDEKVGILLLGEKKSGEIYSERDIGVLEIFGPAISIAIQNAKSYEEIRNFNQRLKKEVQVATGNLKKANQKLMQVGKQKDEFIAIASHELKTPVTSIKLYSQLLHRKFQIAKDEKSALAVAKMDSQVNKLTDLINDLLDISKIEEGKLQLNLAEFDLNSLVEEILADMQLSTKIRIEKELSENEHIKGDRDRLGQVLVNFLTNAIKYSPESKKIIVRTTKDNNTVTVSVEDFGIGLTSKEQGKVFERFNRAGQEGLGGIQGLGLGLYISKEIVTRHKGKIWVKSVKDKGSTFFFSLPKNNKMRLPSYKI
ncbi:MAG TPA: ATP-binding protein [Candidatus Limnocylindrales bacterium]|nr:ATP-binding protein [Candidatus Limnocylindrales bacterium]